MHQNVVDAGVVMLERMILSAAEYAHGYDALSGDLATDTTLDIEGDTGISASGSSVFIATMTSFSFEVLNAVGERVTCEPTIRVVAEITQLNDRAVPLYEIAVFGISVNALTFDTRRDLDVMDDVMENISVYHASASSIQFPIERARDWLTAAFNTMRDFHGTR